MPELPEVETIRKDLKNILVGKKIKEIEILEKKQFIGDPQEILGKKIIDIVRKGKVLSFKFSDDLFLSVHLKLSGQLLFHEDRNNADFKNIIPRANSKKLPGSTTRIIVNFEDSSALFFNDLRKFGWLKVQHNIETSSIDILSDDFTEKYLSSVILKTRKPIKTVLLDQEFIAGIGNIYANDSLWLAQINPLLTSNTLTEKEISTLYTSIKEIINEGVQYKGSSAHDELYMLPDSSKGEYQNHMKVYHREGKECLRKDGGIIIRVKQGGRSSFYCPICQQNNQLEI